MKTTALLLALLCVGSTGFAQQTKPAAKAPAAKAAPIRRPFRSTRRRENLLA